MALMLTSGIVVVYTLRVNMSVAAQEMRDELNWTENQKALILVSLLEPYRKSAFITILYFLLQELILLGLCDGSAPCI